ncbi:DNA-directed RNA polymerase subunit [Dirofilaria immitis]|nr:DNA-directed RNA polymerase subunit [Dirofilaria immitis]
MDIYPDLARFCQTNVPFTSTNVPLTTNRMNTTTIMPAVSWLLSQGFVISPLAPQLSIIPNNYMLPTAISDEQRFRRRRPLRTRELSPIWVPSQQTIQSLTSANNSLHSSRKIVSVAYADPTGGSMIVTRRCQDGHLDVRIIYSREFIVAASASPYALLPPANFRQMVLEMMDIIAKFPKSYYNSIR